MKIRYKLRRLKEIANAYFRLSAAFLYVRLHKNLYREKIWLITEKRDEARDNGYWLFRYLKELHPEVHAYFVIQNKAEDAEKLTRWKDFLIEPDSWKHCIFFLAAEKNISSQNDGAHPFWKTLRHKDLIFWKKAANPMQTVVFLQHGIIINKIPHESFDYGTNPMDLFVVSAEREREFITKTYGYPENSVPNLGLCRFDNLYNKRFAYDKAVLIMPTWRKWLQPQQSDHKNEEVIRFRNSSYFKTFHALLTSGEFLSLLREKGYRVLFYPHYEMQKYIQAFDGIENDVVSICPKDKFDVQELLIRARILITDYSSVFFDFAYMNKPLAYYQFDAEEFNRSHFMQGYFGYDRDGFGPVCTDQAQLIPYIAELIEDDCRNPERYETRAKEFFARFDGLNCQRTYDYIQNFTKPE